MLVSSVPVDIVCALRQVGNGCDGASANRIRYGMEIVAFARPMKSCSGSIQQASAVGLGSHAAGCDCGWIFFL